MALKLILANKTEITVSTHYAGPVERTVKVLIPGLTLVHPNAPDTQMPDKKLELALTEEDIDALVFMLRGH